MCVCGLITFFFSSGFSFQLLSVPGDLLSLRRVSVSSCAAADASRNLVLHFQKDLLHEEAAELPPSPSAASICLWKTLFICTVKATSN